MIFLGQKWRSVCQRRFPEYQLKCSVNRQKVLGRCKLFRVPFHQI